ncbi:MAG TPA: photosystem II protein PsbQ [Cyanobacteria bacterium UBA11369]|nr:photosystem II protein PsbQ [Cyanobacteria bacterium UBA11371]HBE49670.1 photosystem II protein PsbQ [Cyanobacteria bacterium UBA11369]
MVMGRFRSILAVVLACVTVFLVSCSSATEVKPPTYTSAKLELIGKYTSSIEAMRDRLPELAKLIQDENWVFTKNFIRGPLGELRAKMSQVERNLLPNDQPKAKEVGQQVIEDLIGIDAGAEAQDYKATIRSYAALKKDIDAFLGLTPKA